MTILSKISRKNIKELLKEYNEDEVKNIILISEEKKIKIIQSQIIHEIRNRNLIKPIDFILKRHNYSYLLTKNKIINKSLLEILSVFSSEFSYTKKDFLNELYKLIALNIKY